MLALRAALVFVLFVCGYFNVPIVWALERLWDLWKGQWEIGTRRRGVMWMTFSTPSSVIELYSLSEVSHASGGEALTCISARVCILQSRMNLHIASSRLLCQDSLSVCLTLPASILSVSQPRSSLLRRCFSAIMTTGGSTRLLRWSWAASWAERLPGGLMHTQIKLQT